MADPAIIELYQRLGLALGIGFLVGVERGWKHRDAPDGARAAGLRTFSIIGLLGGVAAVLLQPLGVIGFAALFSAFSAAWILFKFREAQRDDDFSVTGTIAGLLVFVLGAMAVLHNMRLAAACAVALTALLAFKHALHQWLDKLSWEEIRSALLLLGATVIALPLLPDRAIDPWGYFNPRELWLLTILVATTSFAGYVAIKLLGARGGLAAGAVAGALVSSTLATVEVGRRVRGNPASLSIGAAAACWASGVSLVRLFSLSLVAAAPLTPLLWRPLGAAALIYAVTGLLFWLRPRRAASDGASQVGRNPLELKPVLVFAGLLAGAILLGKVTSSLWGEAGLLPFAATAGLADVDTVALAAGALQRGGLAVDAGAHAILAAALVNAAAKTLLARASGGTAYALAYGGVSLLAAIAAAGALLLEAHHLIPI